MLSMVNSMIQKFNKNVKQILANSDNTIDDIVSEAFIVLEEHKKEIENNQNVFINELRNRCLKFNKYGKRIESKKRWELFNDRECEYQDRIKNNLNINEDLICYIETIKTIINKDDYDFLIFYYGNDGKRTSEKYNMTEMQVRNRVHYLVNKIKVNIGG